MDKSRRLIFSGLAILLVGFPLVQASRASGTAAINQCIALVGALAAIAASKKLRRASMARFTWPWVVGAGVLGSILLASATVLAIPRLGIVYAYGERHGGIPPRIANSRIVFDLAAAAGGGATSGLIFGLAVCSFLYGFGILDSPPSVEERLRTRGKTSRPNSKR